jgi:hypothetical protein
VDDADAVGRVEGIEDLRGDVQRLEQRQARGALEARGERLADETLHREVRITVGQHAAVDDGHDVRRTEPTESAPRSRPACSRSRRAVQVLLTRDS